VVGGVAAAASAATPRPARKAASLVVGGRGGLGEEATGRKAPLTPPGEPRAEVEALGGRVSADGDGRMGLWFVG
jgi:hypothetical protein